MLCRDFIIPIFILSTSARSLNTNDIIDFLVVHNHLDDGAYRHNGQSPSKRQSAESVFKQSLWVIINPETCLNQIFMDFYGDFQ